MGNDYFIGSDGELYHWQLKNHKYISREKKGGKWVYTYPSESNGAIGKAVKDATKNAIGGIAKTVTKTPTSNEYMIENAYNSKKNNYGNSGNKTTNTSANRVSAGRSALGSANSGGADADVRKVSEVKAYVSSVRNNAKKASENKDVLAKRAESGSGSSGVVDTKRAEQDKNVADFWKAFKNSKEFYTRGNDGTPDTATKMKVAEQSANKKANAEDYKNYLEYKKFGAAKAREHDAWKDDPENGYWQDIELEFQKKTDTKSERGLLGTLVDAAKDWWGDDERDYYNQLASDKRYYDREYAEAGDRAWDTLDKLNKLESASTEGTKRVEYDDLEDAYVSFWNAANRLDWYADRKYACDEAYDKAEEAYRKTKAFQYDQKVQSVEDFFEDVGDSVDEGRDWVEDRLSSLEDWWEELKRK